MLVVNQEEEWDYIPVSEREQKEPFTVVVKPLGIRKMAKLEDGYVLVKEGEGVALNQGTYNTKAVKAGIVSWKNLKDDKGKEYPAKFSSKGEVLDESLNLLPPSIIAELANVIVSISKYPEDAEVLTGNDASK